jgi:hypothetical protein
MADMLGLPAEAKSLDNTKFLALLAAQMVASLIGINFWAGLLLLAHFLH